MASAEGGKDHLEEAGEGGRTVKLIKSLGGGAECGEAGVAWD